MSTTMRVQAIVSLECFVALAAVELPDGQMRLHVGGEQSFLDELLRAVKAFKFALRRVRSDVVVTLVLVLEQHATDVTRELLDVRVLQVVNLQALAGPEFAAADLAVEFLLVVDHLMRSLRISVGECFAATWMRAGEWTWKIIAVNVQHIMLLVVADGAEGFIAVRKVTFELLSRVSPDVSHQIRLHMKARLTFVAFKRFDAVVDLAMNFESLRVLIGSAAAGINAFERFCVLMGFFRMLDKL